MGSEPRFSWAVARRVPVWALSREPVRSDCLVRLSLLPEGADMAKRHDSLAEAQESGGLSRWMAVHWAAGHRRWPQRTKVGYSTAAVQPAET